MGKGSGAKAEVTEFRMSIHMGIALELDSVKKIVVDEKVAWQGNVTSNTTLNINRPDLFGGEKKEGGLVGSIDVLMGRSDQMLTEQAAARYGRLPATCPGFRGLTTLMFRGSGQTATGFSGFWDNFIPDLWDSRIEIDDGTGGSVGSVSSVGNNGFLWKHNSPVIAQKIEVEGTCAPKAPALNPAYAMIGPDANPAHMIYEALVDDGFGMGGSPDAIDTASFEAAAQTLFNEGFGLTILWMRQSTIQSVVNEILDHIQATLFADPATGLMTLKLHRDDYVVDDLFVISPDNAKLSAYRVRSGGQIINELSVTWTNPITEKPESITAHDIASIESQGGEKVSGTRDYYGIRNADLARKVLARDLRESTAPLVSCEAVLDRSAWNIKPGSVVVLNWPRRNMYGLVMRVGKVNYGKPGSTTVRVPLVQDVFSLSRPPIAIDPGTGWVNPSAAPSPLTMQLTTLPAYFSTNALIQTNPVALVEPEVLVMSLADSQDDDSLDYELVTQTAGPDGELLPLTRGAKTMTPLAYLDGTLTAAAESELPAALFPDINWGPTVGGFLWLGYGDTNQEIALVIGRTTTGWTIARGCLDTTPRTWAAGTPVWAVNPGSDLVDVLTVHAGGSTVTYRGLDRTSQGLFPYEDADDVTATLTDRPHLPLRPANVKVGGVGFGSYAIGAASTFTIEWSTRNRLLEDSQVLLWTDGPVTPEHRQETIVRVYDVATDALVAEYPHLWTENSLTFQKTDFDRYASIRVIVSSRRDDLESLVNHSVVVTGFAADAGAALPPEAPPRTEPPAPILAPAVGAFTAVAGTASGPGGSRAPAIMIAGLQDNLDARGLVVRYRPFGSTQQWSLHPQVALDREAVSFPVAGVQGGVEYAVGVAYVIGGIVGQFRSLSSVTTPKSVSDDTANVGGWPVDDLAKYFRELPDLIHERDRTAEVLIREALDRQERIVTEERSRIDGDLAEAQARAAGLMAEAAARGVAIAEVESSVSTVASDLAAEVVTRTTQYAATVAAVGLVESSVATVATDLAAETATRTTQISTINGTLAGHTTSIATNATAISAETTARTAAIATIDGTLASHATSISSNATAISAETAARTAAISAVNASIATVATDVSTVATDLAAETATRTSQVSTINGTLASHATSIATNATAISAETTARTTQISAINDTLAGHTTSIATNATAISAAGTRVSSLEATVDTAGTGLTARVGTVESVSADALGKANALYGVVLDVNGKISGFASVNDGETSSFDVVADKFRLWNGTTGASPFTVDAATGKVYAEGIVVRSGASGARLVITNQLVEVYDSSNVLRVRLGIW